MVRPSTRPKKPVKLFEWSLESLKLDASWTVVDGYMGSGACGVACHRRGINYVGVELVETYFAIACHRLFEAQLNALQPIPDEPPVASEL